ncbi:hypothetical protein N7527_011123 [Penicillium freii]|nr:hypothetical protein N7527_011123 [Penicillium freii]
MERAQNFAGSFKSKAHQLNGNKFYGPVTISATGERDENHTAATQSNSMSESPTRVHDNIDGMSGSGQSEILNWDEYLRWVDEHGLLLIRGKAGCGKSTLLKFALGQQTEAAAPLGSIVLSFFFYSSGTELQSSALGFFRSLLLQLLDQDEYSRPEFMKICRKYCKPREKLQLKWQQVELEAHFQKLVIDCSTRRKILIFVDALDECNDKDRDRLISFIHGLRGQIKSRLNRPGICVTCRPYPDGQIKADFQVRLEEENQDDIESFVEHELRLSDESVTDIEELKRTLLSKADGLFLWLVLIIQQIHHMSGKGLSLRRIKSELLECPQELDKLYEGLLGNIQDDELLEACTLFQWVCFAIRPLSLDELRIAMTVHLSGSKGSLREYEDGDNPQLIPSEAKMRKRMIHLSRGLVDMGSAKLGDGKAIVGFHHDTIRNFMLSKGLSYLNERLHEPRSLTQIASVQLANTCLQYLSTEEICLACQEKEILSRERFQFLGYAATSWVSHAVIAERENLGEEISWPTETILDVWINACKSLENSSSKTATEGTEEDYVHKGAKCFNYFNPRKAENERYFQVGGKRLDDEDGEEKRAGKSQHDASQNSKSTTEHKGRSRIMEKVRRKFEEGKGTNGHLEVVKFLYEHGADTDIHTAAEGGWTPLCAASDSGRLEIVKFLYDHRANVHTATNNGWTPLYAALDSGHLEIVKFLCEHGADVHTATKDGWTPLGTALYSGHLEIVKFLCEHGADVHTATKDSWTPLCAASDSGYLEIVKFLYEHGADVHTATKDGWTPLYAASDSGYLEIVKFLYEHGADVHTATKDGWTPICAASSNGYLEIVKFLYQHGADVHTATKDGITPICAASSNGYLEVVKFLYDHGADADGHTATNSSRTPLAAASYSGHLEVVKFLCEHGARVEAPDIFGRTSLFLASARSHVEAIQQLLSHGAVVDIKDRYGSTPLFAAARNGHETAVMCLLVLQGACVQFEDGFGHTLLWCARKSGNTKVSEAVIQFAGTRGIKVSEVDLAVEASSMATGGSTLSCDSALRWARGV